MTDLGLLNLCHVGIAVPSIAEFTRSWGALLGVSGWLVQEIEQPAGLLQLHGERQGPSRSRIAMGRLADTAIELVEPLDGRTRTSAWLETRGPGIHHLAFWVADLDRAVAALADHADITYSPAARTQPVSAVARGRGPLPLGTQAPDPDFWLYAEPRGGQASWCLELLDARRADVVRATFGDHLVYPAS
ncbi:VOC family protein [Nonomuraea sp. MCN248]|uniref:VOC family protein n=1 Tax=Nonomuraea corallina TaxID=2989783 RepID=A0ABT4S917_9ACTN|nr:VOC family protein [Nonomuraea corallina]MDA0633420.1 VOC family protein [Nonomuraea corallina]